MPRPWMVPVLAVTFVASTIFTGVSAFGTPTPADAPPTAAPRLKTRILSARRAPELLSRTVAQIRLGEELDAAMTTPTACLTVEDGETAIYGHQADLALTPASTLKMLTGTAALRRLGPDFRFVTEVRADRPVIGGVLDGPLWLVGSGDPLLSTQRYADSFRNQPQVFTSLDTLADRIAGAGITEIRGGIVGDESRFDTVRYLPSWKSVYITDNEIGPLSALIVNDNFAQFRPKKTIATPDPSLHGATVLTDLLRGRGLVVADAGAGATPEGAAAIASVSSPALPDIVGELLRESDNMTAEALTKELGKRYGGGGTWAEGTKVIRETVAEAGLAADNYQAVDGSGLDVSDKVSCTLLMDALDLVGPAGPVADGLAIAGQTGTLSLRFKGNPAEGRLRAKTGSLNNVVGLVGFVRAADDRNLEFALLANALPDRTDSGRALQERVGGILAQYPKAPAVEVLAPR
ncbi:MAG TPA: D-alanyl-D-alanine carboxypeptidase/D-alanyl-D-alanine-endopeptidase [Acidimicrobiales bacterium]|nr:D-alanyl-D-alanine carboxypeptidase/D-alanyl-D-alanine-endopeptidase [Acidimicrobiales bacterium]